MTNFYGNVLGVPTLYDAESPDDLPDDFVDTGKPAYDAAVAAAKIASDEEVAVILAQTAQLMVSRSPNRTGAQVLDGAYLDAGKDYAVFLAAGQPWSQVTFQLDGGVDHVEASAPWDLAGTNPDGTAVRLTAIAGSHEAQAVIQLPGGPVVVIANFEVE